MKFWSWIRRNASVGSLFICVCGGLIWAGKFYQVIMDTNEKVTVMSQEWIEHKDWAFIQATQRKKSDLELAKQIDTLRAKEKLPAHMWELMASPQINK
jgi:hypothetical protein